ncbi:MAG: hypothetical protein A3J74_02060 [Elusimicrobia bacterium RIFCSPHIGHO2_02_FULL_57_9]|nr:MAG: hypothetical protein A3J74_02060 [Elusimicrobia bacterium RIFCSPHIGHO2_02_FULL_57_9]
MISSKHLNELLGFKTPTPAVVSLYLDVDCQRAYRAQWRNLQARIPHSKDLDDDFARMDRFLEQDFDAGSFKGLALFSSKRFGLWRACPLPQAVVNRLSVDLKPYLKPLLSLTDQYHRFGVVMVEPKKARFLEVFMGQIREYEEMAIGLSGPLTPNLKVITEKLDGLTRNQGFQRVIVGAAADLAMTLVNHLHSSLQNNLILDSRLEPRMPVSKILETIVDSENAARKVRESVLVHHLLDSAAARMGVLGLEKTLAALQKGQVRLLLLRDGFTKMGRRCPACGLLSLGGLKYVKCHQATEAVFSLVGEMIQKALDLNCEIFRIFNDSPLDNLGRIGAELNAETHPAAQLILAQTTAQPALADSLCPAP